MTKRVNATSGVYQEGMNQIKGRCGDMGVTKIKPMKSTLKRAWTISRT